MRWVIRIWDVATGEAWPTILDHAGRVMTVTFSPDGKSLASGSWDETIRLRGVKRLAPP